MWHDIWGWLQIEPTTDVELIRSAYAKQAKIYHPEEQPLEFQQLQKAYKAAIKYASNNKGNDIDTKSFAQEQIMDNFEFTPNREVIAEQKIGQEITVETSNNNNHTFIFSKYDTKIKSESPKSQNEDSQQFRYQKVHELDNEKIKRLDILGYQLNKIYNNKLYRNNINAWKVLFENYKYPEDFKNPDFLNEFIMDIVKFQKLAKGIQKYIYNIIFAENNSEEYQVLKLKFNTMKKPLNVYTSHKKISSYEVNKILDINSNKHDKAEKVLKKTKVKGQFKFSLLMILIIISIFKLFMILFMNNKTDIPSQAFSPEMVSVMFEASKKNLSIDLNEDGLKEMISYDMGSKCYQVYIYQNDVGQFKLWGSLSDYITKYPDSKDKVKNLIN